MFIIGSLVGITPVRLLPFRICSGLCVCGEAQKPAGSTGMLFSGPWYVSFSLISDGASPALLLLSHLCLFLRYFWGAVRQVHVHCSAVYACHVFPPKLPVLGHCRIPMGTEALSGEGQEVLPPQPLSFLLVNRWCSSTACAQTVGSILSSGKRSLTQADAWSTGH